MAQFPFRLPSLIPVPRKHPLPKCCDIGFRDWEDFVRPEELEFVASGIAGYLGDDVQIDEEGTKDMEEEGIGMINNVSSTKIIG